MTVSIAVTNSASISTWKNVPRMAKAPTTMITSWSSGSESGDAELPVAEPVGDPGHDPERSDEDEDERLVDEVGADDRADRREARLLVDQAELVLERGDHLREHALGRGSVTAPGATDGDGQRRARRGAPARRRRRGRRGTGRGGRGGGRASRTPPPTVTPRDWRSGRATPTGRAGADALRLDLDEAGARAAGARFQPVFLEDRLDLIRGDRRILELDLPAGAWCSRS